MDWYHQQPDYSTKLLLLLVAWMATAAAVNTLLLVGPVVTGRWLFSVAQLPFKSDLFTGSLGALVLWAVGSLVHALVMAASLRNLRAVAAAGLRWAGLVGKCGLLAVLWFGVVGTLVGLLCELVLLPLRLPPNQTALIYIYQVRRVGCVRGGRWGRESASSASSRRLFVSYRFCLVVHHFVCIVCIAALHPPTAHAISRC